MKIQIRQIYFSAVQKGALCNRFEPYDNSQDPDGQTWFEYGVIRRSYYEQWYKNSDYSGIVSWRFEEKTSVKGNEFLNFIRNNRGYDVYFINPFPSEELLCPNVWIQGEIAHPGMMEAINTIFKKLGRDIQADEIDMKPEKIAYSNYWVGNAKFWKKYMDFTMPVADLIANDPEIRALAFRDANYDYDAPMIPFLMERLFSTFLCVNKSIRSKKFNYPARILNQKYADSITMLYQQLKYQENRYKQSGSYQLGYNLRHHPLRVIPMLMRKLFKANTKSSRPAH